MATTYKDIYNAETRGLATLLLGWRWEAVTRFGAGSEESYAAFDACQDLFREWARTHDTRP